MIQITLNLNLFKGKTYSDGSHPIMLKYNYSGKTKGKVISRCLPDHWDQKSRRLKLKAPNATVKNLFITEQYLEAEALLYDIKAGHKTVNDIFKPVAPITLAQAIDEDCKRLKDEMKVTACVRLKSFRKHLATEYDIERLPLKHMDLDWFKGFVSKLKKKGNIGSTAQKTFKTVRALLIRYSTEPVDHGLKSFKVPALKTVKAKLTAEELAAIENLQLPDGEMITAARDIFLMQVYLRGIRIGDLLQAYARDFADGSFRYIADKTGKGASIKLIPKAVAIFEKYNGLHDRLFPFFIWNPNNKLSEFDNEHARIKHKHACTSIVNRHLKDIGSKISLNKPLTTHIARHTFARMAIDKINNPMVTMDLLGHSSLAVHQGYLKDIRNDEVLDQAAGEIFG